LALPSEKYVWKEIPASSHDVLRRRIRRLPPRRRLLDLGAAGGHLGRAVRDRCAYLAGAEPDPAVPDSAREGYDDWRSSDALSAGAWPEPFDVVVCADVLEHLPEPERLLEKIAAWLAPGGTLFVSLPNVANVSVRAALLAGRFRYAERGILDRTHLRFFTLATGRELLERSGFRIAAAEPTAMPYELASPALAGAPWNGPVRAFAQTSARLLPTLFGYQFVFEAFREPTPTQNPTPPTSSPPSAGERDASLPRFTSAPAATEGRASRTERPAGRGEGAA
jgi:SAM-dependent methyltransferase